MVRPTIGTNVWLSIISGITLVMWALSSPIGIRQAPNVRIDAHPLPESSAHSSDGPAAVFTAVRPDGASIEAARSDFIEKNENESSCSFSHLASPAFMPSDWPSYSLSGPLPGDTAARIVTLPLRC